MLDWVALAKGHGIDARRATDIDEFTAALGLGLAAEGSFLIKLVCYQQRLQHRRPLSGRRPSAEEIEVGFSPHGIPIDSRGNARVANLAGHPGAREKLALVKQKLEARAEELRGSMSDDEVAIRGWIDLWGIINEFPGGDVSMISPDGTVHDPFDAGGSITGPWGIAIGGNDNVWVAGSTSHSVTQLCCARTDTCPPGHAIGDPISPAQVCERRVSGSWRGRSSARYPSGPDESFGIKLDLRASISG